MRAPDGATPLSVIPDNDPGSREQEKRISRPLTLDPTSS
jgi:hypothetical protein